MTKTVWDLRDEYEENANKLSAENKLMQSFVERAKVDACNEVIATIPDNILQEIEEQGKKVEESYKNLFPDFETALKNPKPTTTVYQNYWIEKGKLEGMKSVALAKGLDVEKLKEYGIILDSYNTPGS